MLSCGEILAVRTPDGVVHEPKRLTRYGVRFGTVTIHDPDVVPATPVGSECDRRTIRAVARLHVPREAVGQGYRFAACDRNFVQVAQ